MSQKDKGSELWTKDIYILTNLGLFMFVLLNLKYEKNEMCFLIVNRPILNVLIMM